MSATADPKAPTSARYEYHVSRWTGLVCDENIVATSIGLDHAIRDARRMSRSHPDQTVYVRRLRVDVPDAPLETVGAFRNGRRLRA